ncbi:MAG: hypothetical protein ACC648_10265, partial [Thiohalobacterales bacterium]
VERYFYIYVLVKENEMQYGINDRGRAELEMLRREYFVCVLFHKETSRYSQNHRSMTPLGRNVFQILEI